MNRKLFSAAFRSTIPVMSGYLVLGTAFGVLAKTSGFSVCQGLSMSLFIFAGSLQFVLVSLLQSAPSLLLVALTSLAVNARHLLYGISMAESYRGAGKYRPYMIFSLTDETFSLVCHLPETLDSKEKMPYCFLVSVLDHCWWVLGTLTGLLLGSAASFNTKGLDFALTALFITVFSDQWTSTKEHGSALIGLGAGVASLLLFGKDSFLIPAMVLLTAALLLTGRKESEGEKKTEAKDEAEAGKDTE